MLKKRRLSQCLQLVCIEDDLLAAVTGGEIDVVPTNCADLRREAKEYGDKAAADPSDARSRNKADYRDGLYKKICPPLTS